MKTTRIFLSIIGIALATSAFGQFSFIKERISSQRQPQVAMYTADYKKDNSRIENWMYDLHSWATDKITKKEYEAPEVVYTFKMVSAEVVYEEELGLESWMTTPFDSGVKEEVLEIESWMTTPFENAVYEQGIVLEPWMTVPFENSLDEEIILESWMTAPFWTDEEIELEEWMTAAWI